MIGVAVALYSVKRGSDLLLDVTPLSPPDIAVSLIGWGWLLATGLALGFWTLMRWWRPRALGGLVLLMLSAAVAGYVLLWIVIGEEPVPTALAASKGSLIAVLLLLAGSGSILIYSGGLRVAARAKRAFRANPGNAYLHYGREWADRVRPRSQVSQEQPAISGANQVPDLSDRLGDVQRELHASKRREWMLFVTGVALGYLGNIVVAVGEQQGWL